MNATRLASSEGARETAPARSVRAMLLQLAYNLHATHVVAVLPLSRRTRPIAGVSRVARLPAARPDRGRNP